jgi:hypothetical protein
MMMIQDGERGQVMIHAKRAVSLLALSAWVAIIIPAGGQSRSGAANPDKLLGAWEKQLVLPQLVSGRLTWAQRRLKPSGLRKLEKMGRTLAPKIAGGDDFDSLRAQAEREVASSFAGLSRTGDSEAAFIVLSMATKDMDEDIRAVMTEAKRSLDGMNGISEMTSLRLQMTMDRRSKFIQTLSNIMKKIGTTQETLVQNIK